MSAWLRIEFRAPLPPALPTWLRRRERCDQRALETSDETPCLERNSECERIHRTTRPPIEELRPRVQAARPVRDLLALGRFVVRLVEEGRLPSYAQAARAMGLSRARVTQITNLTLLAPDVQRALIDGQIQCGEHDLRRCLRSRDWGAQRRALRPFRRREGGRRFR